MSFSRNSSPRNGPRTWKTQYPALFQESMDFVYDRTKGEKAQQLRKLYNNPGYDRSEIARADEFIDAYIGKDYSASLKDIKRWYGKDVDLDSWGFIESPWDKNRYVSGGELVSMGLEAMTDQAYWFARADPGHFDFIFERVMHRGLIEVQ